MTSKRKWLGPGSRTSYKLPVIPGEEGKKFYKWLNKCESINGAITEALKIKFMIDTVANIDTKINTENVKNDNINKTPYGYEIDIEDVDIFAEEVKKVNNGFKSKSQNIDIETIKRTFKSVKR